MATIKEVKEQIQNANALGRANLTEKGVEISENATTFDIMTAIAEISGSGGGDVIIGADYTNIVYNEDNTITLTDKDGVIHTMECEYTDGKLTSVKYDGKKVELTYDGDVLVKVGKTEIDLEKLSVFSGTDYTEAYDLLSKDLPVEETESDMLDFVGSMIGVIE